MAKRSIDLCMVDPIKVAKLEPFLQLKLINFIQNLQVGSHSFYELEAFIAFYHDKQSDDMEVLSSFSFTSKDILIDIYQRPENVSFWNAVKKTHERYFKQCNESANFYGPDILDENFLYDHPFPSLSFTIPYRDISYFFTLVLAANH